MQHFSDSRWWARIANQLLNAVSYGSLLYMALLKKPRNGLGGLWGLVLTLGTVVGTGTAPGPRVTKHTSGKRLWVVWELKCLCKSAALLSVQRQKPTQLKRCSWLDLMLQNIWCGGPGVGLGSICQGRGENSSSLLAELKTWLLQTSLFTFVASLLPFPCNNCLLYLLKAAPHCP